MSLRKVWWVSDPLCSWCWGMASDFAQVRAALAGRVQFDLLLGGINVQAVTPLSLQAQAGLLPRFQEIWHRVAHVTGQTFAMRFPAEDTFVYNSLPQCRAVAALRKQLGRAPFAYLHALQSAFFVDARDTSSLLVMAELAACEGVAPEDFLTALNDPELDAALALEMQIARGYGTTALPTVLVETEHGRSLLAGGYADAPTLQQLIEEWLNRHPVVLN